LGTESNYKSQCHWGQAICNQFKDRHADITTFELTQTVEAMPMSI